MLAVVSISAAVGVCQALPDVGGIAHAQPADAAAKKLLAANGLFSRQLYKLAADQYEEFLKDSPRHAEAPVARYALAVCRYRIGEYQKAAEALEQVVSGPKIAQADEALLVLGHSHLALKQYDKAAAAFERLIESYPQSKTAAAAMLGRGQALLLAGNADEAARQVEGYLKLFPAHAQRAEGFYFLALARQALGQHDPAITALKELIEKHSEARQKFDALLLLGQVYEAQGKLDQAAEQYAKLAQIGGEDMAARAQYQLAVMHYRQQKFADAAAILKKVVEAPAVSEPIARAARMQLALTHVAAKDYDAARQVLAQVIQRDPARAIQAKYWLAQCDIGQKQYEAALAKLNELAQLESRPEPANRDQIELDRGDCLIALGRYAEAAGRFGQFVKTYPRHAQVAEAAYRQAFALHKTGAYDKSLEIIAALKPASAKTQRATKELSAENVFLLGKYAEAGRQFEQLRQSAPDEASKRRMTVRLGQCAYFAADYPRAIDVLSTVAQDKALRSDTELSRALLLMGDAMLQTQQYSDAAKALADYAALPVTSATDKAEAQFKQGMAHLRGGEADAAAKALSSVAGGDFQSPWVQRANFELGQLHYRRNNHEQARKTLTRVAEEKNAPPEIAAPAAYLLGWIHFDTKKYAEAAKAFGQVAARFPKEPLAAEAAFHQAVALREAGEDAKALELFNRYVKDYPNGPQVVKAKQLAAAALVRMARYGEAAKALAALAVDPGTVSDEVLYDLAWSQQSAKDPSAAEATYRKLISDYSRSKLVHPARSELAELLFARQQYPEAAKLLEQVIADKEGPAKTVAVALYRLGSTYEKLGQTDKAARMFEEFGRKHADDELAGWARYQAGVNFAREQKLEEARKQLEAALKGSPKAELESVATLKLAEVVAQSGDLDGSRKLYERFLEKWPKDRFAPQAMFGIGWAKEQAKQYTEARAWYEKVVAATNSPVAARAQFQIGETFFAQGKYEEAVAALLAVADVYAYPEWAARATLEAGRAFEQLKQPQQARQQYELVVQKYKQSAEAALAAKRLAQMQ